MQTVNNRLCDLENVLSMSQDCDIVTKMKKLEDQKKRDNIEKMNSTFNEYITENINDATTSDYVNILIHTVKYCRQNNHSISRVLGIKPSLELELETCVHFVKQIYGDTFSEDMIKGNSFSVSQILYPALNVCTENIQEESKAIDDKKKFKKFKIFK